MDTNVDAQSTGQYLEVETRDNVADVLIYSGLISEGTSKDTLYLLTKNEVIVKIAYADILNMSTQKGQLTNPSIRDKTDDSDWEIEEHEVKEKYAFKEKGMYLVGGVDLNFKTEDFVEGFPGAEITMGYRFNRKIGLGVGLGLRKWTYDLRPNNVGHIFAEARGFFSKTKVSPYYRLRVGYGDIVGGTPNNIFFNEGYESSDGGLFLSPGIGIRFLGNSKFQMNLETGWAHQQTTYYNTDFGALERKYKFDRHYIGISLMY